MRADNQIQPGTWDGNLELGILSKMVGDLCQGGNGMRNSVNWSATWNCLCDMNKWKLFSVMLSEDPVNGRNCGLIFRQLEVGDRVQCLSLLTIQNLYLIKANTVEKCFQ